MEISEIRAKSTEIKNETRRNFNTGKRIDDIIQPILDRIENYEGGQDIFAALGLDAVSGDVTLFLNARGQLTAPSIIEPFGYALGSATSDAVAIVVPISIPFGISLTSIHAKLGTAATGSRFTIDVKKNGTSIFSTLLTFDASELSTLTSSIPYVLTTNPTVFAVSDVLLVEITQVGAATAGKAPIIWFIGTKTT